MFLLVPAYPGCPGSKAIKRSLLLLFVVTCLFCGFLSAFFVATLTTAYSRRVSTGTDWVAVGF